LKNFLHGTKSYMNQISNQIIVYKQLSKQFRELKNKKDDLYAFTASHFTLKSEHSQPIELVGSIIKRKLNNFEIFLFKRKFHIEPICATTVSRIRINNKVYHSIKYDRRGVSDSYSVMYARKNNYKYCQIVEYIQIGDKFYALINKMKVIIDNPILKNGSGVFFSLLTRDNLFNDYFKLVNIDDSISLISCEKIMRRCIITNNGKQTYLSVNNIDFEHD
jgi:hypothetical protein